MNRVRYIGADDRVGYGSGDGSDDGSDGRSNCGKRMDGIALLYCSGTLKVCALQVCMSG